MFIERNNKAYRKYDTILSNDKSYLRNYYSTHKRFPLFSQVLIETRTDCNKSCNFCPQSYFHRSDGSMKWNIFKRIIDSLADIEFAGRIAFLVSNEPLLEKRLIRMIRYAKRKSPLFFLDITTNGTLLTLTKIEQMFLAGLDNININDYRHDRGKYPNKISKNLVPVIEKFRSNPKINYIPRRSDEVLTNYGGVVPQNYDNSLYGFCNFPFRKLTISFKGHVLLCCNDFKEETNFGNIAEEPLLKIWHSEKLNDIRNALLKDERRGLCACCNEKQSYSIY